MRRIFTAPVRREPGPPIPILSLLVVIAAAAMLAACSPQSASHAAGESPPQAGAKAQVAPNVPATHAADLGTPHTACWLLPGVVVSKALGESLTPVADLGAMEYGNTSCNYYAPGSDPGDDLPRLTVTLDWNGYNTIAMQIPKAGPATAAAPYADIGDGALLDHGVLFVRAGKHSLALDLRGDGDLHAIAAQLMNAAKPTLGNSRQAQ